jgi:hypothetical protein
MNAKTYCPLGKIYCIKYDGCADYSHGEIRCLGRSDLPELFERYIEVCPIPSKQIK